jgi:threonine 3-dehydrogenase
LAEEMIAVRKMKAAPGLDVTTAKIPKIDKKDVLVKVRACSICGSDVHIYNWEPPLSERVKPPRTLGHEVTGEIVEVGKDVKNVQIGDYVSLESHIACGNCHQCNNGKPHICETMKILGIDIDGGYAEYVSIPAVNAWKISKDMPPEIATVLEPMGNSVYTVVSGDVKGKVVTIFGCGPTGLFAVGLSKALGAKKIIAIDRKKFRLNLAKKMGADLVINGDEENAIKEILDATDGLGADVFLEMSGSIIAIEQGFKSLKAGGRVVALGLPSEPVKLDWSKDIVQKLVSIQGIFGREMFKTWHEMSHILASGKLDISPIITHKFKLKDFDKAIQIAKSGDAGKVVLFP